MSTTFTGNCISGLNTTDSTAATLVTITMISGSIRTGSWEGKPHFLSSFEESDIYIGNSCIKDADDIIYTLRTGHINYNIPFVVYSFCS